MKRSDGCLMLMLMSLPVMFRQPWSISDTVVLQNSSTGVHGEGQSLSDKDSKYTKRTITCIKVIKLGFGSFPGGIKTIRDWQVCLPSNGKRLLLRSAHTGNSKRARLTRGNDGWLTESVVWMLSFSIMWFFHDLICLRSVWVIHSKVKESINREVWKRVTQIYIAFLSLPSSRSYKESLGDITAMLKRLSEILRQSIPLDHMPLQLALCRNQTA